MIKEGDIIIDRYRIKEILGEGGMAIVYLAFDLVSKREVAIKIIKEETMKNPVNLSRFEREARAAASLNHQNVVRVINLGTYEGRPFMVNELIKGQTLKDMLKERGRFTFLEACDIMYQLCSAIIHAHQHGVIHRDIKPENVFVTQDGTVKLGDFGIATFQDNNVRVTKSEVVVGSVHYLAPELSQGAPDDDQSAVAVALKHINEKFPSAKKFNSKTPAIIDKIIQKACMKNPSDRYKDVFEMRKDIDRILREPSLIKKKSFFERLFRK